MYDGQKENMFGKGQMVKCLKINIFFTSLILDIMFLIIVKFLSYLVY